MNEIALCDNKLLNMDLLVTSKEEAASTFLSYIAAVEKVYRYIATFLCVVVYICFSLM